MQGIRFETEASLLLMFMSTVIGNIIDCVSFTKVLVDMVEAKLDDDS